MGADHVTVQGAHVIASADSEAGAKLMAEEVGATTAQGEGEEDATSPPTTPATWNFSTSDELLAASDLELTDEELKDRDENQLPSDARIHRKMARTSTVGIVGAGSQVGRRVARALTVGFGATVLAYDPFLSDDDRRAAEGPAVRAARRVRPGACCRGLAPALA